MVPAPLVLHVLPVDLSRGAQTYARELRLAADGPDVRHRTLTLFRSPGAALQADWTLAVPDGAVRQRALDPRVVLRLRRLLKVEMPAVVVAHGGEPLNYAALAGVGNDRLVYYKIGIGGSRLDGISGRLHRAALDRTGLVATVSDDAAVELRELGVPEDRITVIPNGRDPGAYAPQPVDRTADGDAPVRLVFVGHLTASKRPQRFVDLVARLRAAGFPVQAAIAGDGPMLQELRDRGADAGVDVLGRVSDVPGLLGRSDIFVFTSVPEGEGMPGVMIEAGLAGLPVVTTDVAGAGAVVADGETGFVVPVDDVDAMFTAVRALVEDAALRARFGAAARQRCVARFSLDASVDAWRKLLARMMADPCASST